MASFQKNHPLNVPGPVYTDTTCIDCGTCYHLAPKIFKENSDENSIVVNQPESLTEWQQSKRALLSCPTNSIGVKDAPDDFSLLEPGLPLTVEGEVSYLGYTSRDSFGASSYLIEREDGNILVDSPRFHPWLVKEIEKRGGVKLMILTHQDDVADHKKFHQYFKCDRLIHVSEVSDDTNDCEQILQEDRDFYLFPDLKILMTPGHTRGHINILYKDQFLFTGDHLFVSQQKGKLRASKGVCWYSWSEQIKSTEKLLNENFQWVMPGHGGWGKFSREEILIELTDLIKIMKGYNERV